MPRPKKCRRICALPRCSSFGPLEGAADGRVEMAVEEYEAIRLIDLLGCTQEECAAQMSRPGLRPAGLRYGTLWLRRVPAVQGKLGGYENENRGYL